MTTATLPPLPEPVGAVMPEDGSEYLDCYTADQMRAYAIKALATTPCIQWPGNITLEGYGRMMVRGGKCIRAHVASWERTYGAIPDGMVLDHLCRNRSCINPLHMEPVSSRENTLRGIGPSAVNAFKTHCKMGHPFSGDNLGVTKRGRRYCRTCQRGYDKQWRNNRAANEKDTTA
jgi:hypothetical protein